MPNVSGKIDPARIDGPGAAVGHVMTWDGGRSKWMAPAGASGYRGGAISTPWLGGPLGATYKPWGGDLLQTVGSLVIPMAVNDEVTAYPDGGGYGSWSNLDFGIVRVADSSGVPIGTAGAASAMRSMTGSGYTAVSFPAYTATADYTSPTVADADAGYKVLVAGWYLVVCSVIWDS